jgi:hypothetical protein
MALFRDEADVQVLGNKVGFVRFATALISRIDTKFRQESDSAKNLLTHLHLIGMKSQKIK